MTYRLDIIVVTGLVINLIAGISYAANQNPWAMYGGQRGGNTGSVPFKQPQKQMRQQPTPRQFNYEYAPLNNNRSNPSRPGNRQPNVPGYGYQPYGQGNIGGQFGFGMNFNPGFGGSGFMPGFGGFGVPSMPFFGGSNNYGAPYQGIPYQRAPYQRAPYQVIPNQGIQGQAVPGAQYGYPYGNPYRNPYGNSYGRTAPWGMGFPMF